MLSKWCEEVLYLLESVEPPEIPTVLNTQTVLIFSDGSWENDVAGIAVNLDESTGNHLVIQDQVNQDLLLLWKDAVGDHIIC